MEPKLSSLNKEKIKNWVKKDLLVKNGDISRAVILTINKVKEELKSNYYFYLKYKNNPFCFFKDFPEKFGLFKKETNVNMPNNHYEILKYNEWLFKEAFKPIFENGKNETD